MGRRGPTVSERNAMAVYLNGRGAHDLAISELKKARRLAPRSAVIHYNLGAAYFGKRDLDRSLSAVKVSLDLEPEHVRARLLLGFILEAKGLYEESRRAFEWVVERDPSGRSGQEAKDALVSLESKSHDATRSPQIFPSKRKGQFRDGLR